MPGNFKKEDLRIIKTEKALMTAMSKLLAHQNFAKITVNGLCEEALISRATFYTRFIDKYDFLNCWLNNIKSEIINNSKDNLENNISFFINGNKKLINNLLEDANNETFKLICDFMFSLLDIYIEKNEGGQFNPKYIVFSEFCSGGLVNYLKWQAESKSSENLSVMNTHLYSLLITMLKWYTD